MQNYDVSIATNRSKQLNSPVSRRWFKTPQRHWNATAQQQSGKCSVHYLSLVFKTTGSYIEYNPWIMHTVWALLCFVVLLFSVGFTQISQSYFLCTMATIPQCQWSNPGGNGLINHKNPLRTNHITTKNNAQRTTSIFYGQTIAFIYERLRLGYTRLSVSISDSLWLCSDYNICVFRMGNVTLVGITWTSNQ